MAERVERVHAIQMTLGEHMCATGRDSDVDAHSNQLGYVLEYNDGFKGWVSMEVFNRAYTQSGHGWVCNFPNKLTRVGY